MADENQKKQEHGIEGFMSENDFVEKFYGIPKAKKPELKEHFKAKEIKITKNELLKLKKAVLEIFRHVAPEYEVEKINDFEVANASGSYNAVNDCYVFKIATEDNIRLSARGIKYLGNGHVKISHRIIYCLGEIIKNKNRLSERDYLIEFIKPLLKKSDESLAKLLQPEIRPESEKIIDINEILIKTPKEKLKCEVSEEFFSLEEIVEFAEKEFDGKTVAGMQATNEKYVEGNYGEESRIIEIKKSDPILKKILVNYGLEKIKGIIHGPEIINAIAQQDYKQASEFNEKYFKGRMPQEYQLISDAISKHKSDHAHN